MRRRKMLFTYLLFSQSNLEFVMIGQPAIHVSKLYSFRLVHGHRGCILSQAVILRVYRGTFSPTVAALQGGYTDLRT